MRKLLVTFAALAAFVPALAQGSTIDCLEEDVRVTAISGDWELGGGTRPVDVGESVHTFIIPTSHPMRITSNQGFDDTACTTWTPKPSDRINPKGEVVMKDGKKYHTGIWSVEFKDGCSRGLSITCSIHGDMGGKNRINWNTACSRGGKPASTPKPAPAPPSDNKCTSYKNRKDCEAKVSEKCRWTVSTSGSKCDDRGNVPVFTAKPKPTTSPKPTPPGQTPPPPKPTSSTPERPTAAPCAKDEPKKIKLAVTMKKGDLYQDEDVRIVADAKPVICNNRSTGAVKVRWTVTPALNTGKPITQGRMLIIPAGSMSNGKQYTAKATATLWVSGGNDITAEETVKFTVTDKPAQLSIYGGKTQTHSTSGFSIVLMDRNRPIASKSLTTWYCNECKSGNCNSQCKLGTLNSPDAVAGRLLTTKASKLTLTQVPAGIYKFTASYKGKSVEVRVTATADAYIPVKAIGPKGDKHPITQPMRVYCSYKLPPGSSGKPSITWTGMRGGIANTKDQKTITLTPAMLEKYGTSSGSSISVRCRVEAKVNGKTISGAGEFAVSFYKKKQGNCTVTLEDGTTGGPYIGMESRVRITAYDFEDEIPSGGSSIEYSFGVQKSNKMFRPLSRMPQSESGVFSTGAPYSDFTTICPFAPSGEVVFVARAMENGKIVGEALCPLTDIQKPSDLAATANTKATEMETAATNGDSSSVLEAAMVAVEAMNGTAAGTDKATRKSIRGKLIVSLGKVFGGAGKSNTMSKDDRRSTVDTLFRSVRKAKRANKPAGAGGAADDEDDALSADEKKELLSLFQSIIDVTDSENVDTADDQAESLLGIVSALADDKATAKRETRKLAKLMAKNIQVGDNQKVKNEDFALEVKSLPKDDAFDADVTTDDLSLALPPNTDQQYGNAAILDEATDVSVATVVHESSPVSYSSGWLADAPMQSKAAEIDMMADGQDLELKDLKTPIGIKMTVTQAGTGLYPMCVYEATNSSWSTGGMTTVPTAVPTEVLCQTTHLSMFGVVSTTTPPPATPQPPTPAGDTPSASAGSAASSPGSLITGDGNDDASGASPASVILVGLASLMVFAL